MNFEYEYGTLKPITDPRGGSTDWEESLKRYGFGDPPIRFGPEYGFHINRFGPSTNEAAPYEWLCEFGDGDHSIALVWCATGADVYGYLRDSAPLLVAADLSVIRETLERAEDLLLAEDGIYGYQVSNVRRERKRRAQALRERCKKADT